MNHRNARPEMCLEVFKMHENECWTTFFLLWLRYFFHLRTECNSKNRTHDMVPKCNMPQLIRTTGRYCSQTTKNTVYFLLYAIALNNDSAAHRNEFNSQNTYRLLPATHTQINTCINSMATVFLKMRKKMKSRIQFRLKRNLLLISNCFANCSLTVVVIIVIIYYNKLCI